MRGLWRIFVLLFLVLTLSSTLKAKSQPFGLAGNAPLEQNRLVVFEAFLRST